MTAVDIVLNLPILPWCGVITAAWSTLAVFMIGALASRVGGKSLFALPTLGNVFWRRVSAGVIMIVILCLLPSSYGLIWLSAKFTVGIVTYVVMACALDVAGCLSTFKS